jgi:hypothetical protein
MDASFEQLLTTPAGAAAGGNVIDFNDLGD